MIGFCVVFSKSDKSFTWGHNKSYPGNISADKPLAKCAAPGVAGFLCISVLTVCQFLLFNAAPLYFKDIITMAFIYKRSSNNRVQNFSNLVYVTLGFPKCFFRI